MTSRFRPSSTQATEQEPIATCWTRFSTPGPQAQSDSSQSYVCDTTPVIIKPYSFPNPVMVQPPLATILAINPQLTTLPPVSHIPQTKFSLKEIERLVRLAADKEPRTNTPFSNFFPMPHGLYNAFQNIGSLPHGLYNTLPTHYLWVIHLYCSEEVGLLMPSQAQVAVFI